MCSLMVHLGGGNIRQTWELKPAADANETFRLSMNGSPHPNYHQNADGFTVANIGKHQFWVYPICVCMHRLNFWFSPLALPTRISCRHFDGNPQQPPFAGHETYDLFLHSSQSLGSFLLLCEDVPKAISENTLESRHQRSASVQMTPNSK